MVVRTGAGKCCHIDKDGFEYRCVTFLLKMISYAVRQRIGVAAPCPNCFFNQQKRPQSMPGLVNLKVKVHINKITATRTTFHILPTKMVNAMAKL